MYFEYISGRDAANFEVAFKALYMKLNACGIPRMMILGQDKGLKEEIATTIDKKNRIEELLGAEALQSLFMEINGIGCNFKDWLNEW